MIAKAGERELERTILNALTGKRIDLNRISRDRLEASGGWVWSSAEDFDTDYALDPVQLWTFLSATQVTSDSERQFLDLSPESTNREMFLKALRWELSRRGIIDLLRRGMSFGPLHINLLYGLADPARGTYRHFRQNRFSVTPRLRYSQDPRQSALDLCLFINGLPVITLQLAEGLERGTIDEAIAWYKRIPLVDEPLFQPGTCLVHFAVNEQRVAFCADLRERDSEFRPFNQGLSDDAENPPNLFGMATEYLWRKILTRRGVTDIIEEYAQITSAKDEWSTRERQTTVFPRYHQLEVVRQLVADIDFFGVGRRYLVQHAPGSGKSQSLVWLVSQLIDLEQVEIAMFGTVVVITDRPASERWLVETIRQFARISAIVDDRGVETARIEEHLESPNRILLVHPQDLPFVLEEIRVHFHGSGYAIIIDEIQPGQGSDIEDQVNRAMRGHEFLANTSYFVFTSKPNDTTLEIFGQPFNDHGITRYRPFHQHGLDSRV